MNKICLYTAITGSYDNLKDIKYKEDSIDYICFTNNKNIKSNTWQVRYIDEDLDNLTLARKIKIIGYKYLSNYDITIWIDGAFQLQQPVTNYLNDLCELDKYDLVYINHEERDCIYDEINECVKLRRESVENALNIEKFLLKEKYPKHNGLIASGVLVRKNKKDINDLMDDWFYMLKTYTRRDQLSFNYCLWKKPVKYKILNIPYYHNDYFKHDFHGEDKTYDTRKYYLYYGNYDEFDFHKFSENLYTVAELKNGLEIKLKESTKELNLFLDEESSFINSVEINYPCEYIIKNICDLGGSNYFYGPSIITFNGDFKKNDKVMIKIDILRTPDGYKNFEINELSKIIVKLNDEIVSLKSKSQKISKIKNIIDNIKGVKNEKK